MDRAYRRQGIGGALIEACMAWAANAGASTVRLEVRASNAAAMALYHRHGFSDRRGPPRLLLGSRGRRACCSRPPYLYNSPRVWSQTWFVTDTFMVLGFIAAGVLVFLVTGHWTWAVVPVLLACFFFWFFRDPKRPVPAEAGLVVSPADGKITEVARIQTPAGERIRLSIFLSVFDVHVNRSPIAGTVREVRYQKGKYLNALNRQVCGKKRAEHGHRARR